MYNDSEFKKHLSSNEYKNLYLIFGDEKMVVKSMTTNLLKKISSNDLNEFNYHEFDNDSLIEDISIAVDVMPFTSSINIVKIKDMDFDAMSKSDFEDIMSIIENVPETTTIIFTMPTLDNVEKKAFVRVKNYIDKNGIVCNAEYRTNLGLEKILCKWAKEAGCSMTDLTASKLIKYSGTDLNILHSEIEKLSAYADGNEITPPMIDKLVNENLEARVFDLFTYVVSKNLDKAIKTLDILFYQREEPITIAIVLGNSYVDAYRVRVAIESGVSLKEIAEKFEYKNRAWVLDKLSKQIKYMTTSALRDSIDEIVKTQQKLLSISINAQIEIERLVSKLVILAERKQDE